MIISSVVIAVFSISNGLVTSHEISMVSYRYIHYNIILQLATFEGDSTLIFPKFMYKALGLCPYTPDIPSYTRKCSEDLSCYQSKYPDPRFRNVVPIIGFLLRGACKI